MVQVVDGIELDRDELTPDGMDEQIRFYFDLHDVSNTFPSVTSVTGFRHDPDKDTAIGYWKKKYDGEPGTGNYWKDIMQYKGWRGTLAHYLCLNPLSEEEIWGDEEEESQTAIDEFGDYQDEDAKQQSMRELNWVKNEWDQLTSDYNITEDSVRDVEQFVLDHDYNYGGQFDITYDLHTGKTILGDIKTSKLRHQSGSDGQGRFDPSELHEYAWNRVTGYAMQLSAYANAIEYDVDECRIYWMSPDTKNVTVVKEGDWRRSRQSYFREFAGLATRLNDETLRNVEDVINTHDS